MNSTYNIRPIGEMEAVCFNISHDTKDLLNIMFKVDQTERLCWRLLQRPDAKDNKTDTSCERLTNITVL